MCTVVALKKFKIGVSQGGIRGYENLILAIFAYFFLDFSLLHQFTIMESCYILFTISLEHPNEYFCDI